VQLRDGETATIESIRERASSELARYKHPNDVIFVQQIRRTPAGKADYTWAQTVAAER
jgi:acyl-CoA synthetase (AMP-forming)/AMP-acid ligase II